LALLVFFWRDWVRIIRGLATSIVRREVRTSEQRLGWLLVLGTVPVGIVGLLLEHTFRTILSRPVPTAVFLVINGLILLGAEMLRRRATSPQPAAGAAAAPAEGPEGADPDARTVTLRVGVGSTTATAAETSDDRLGRMPVLRAIGIGAAQIAALCPGISRSGVTMSAGLLRGLSHEDAARFSFLLSTPVILAAGVLKVGDLAGPLGDGVRPQILVGSLLSFVGAYLSVRFLTKYFEDRSLRPFGVYCIVVGAACLAWFAIR
jgi:undecaprenyl-diphosphatase